MKERFLDFYRREWPRVAAVQAMALGGASILAGRKRQKNLRALAVMNAMTMCAHQYEEYVDPGWFPGMVNVGMFKSDQPLNYPFNANSAMCANISFRAIYVPAMIWPKIKWLGLPPVLLGMVQAFAHGILMPYMLGTKYSPGALTAGLLHLPIGINYLTAIHDDGPISRRDWVYTVLVLAGFGVLGVAAPNILAADKNSPYHFDAKQLGPFSTEPADRVATQS